MSSTRTPFKEDKHIQEIRKAQFWKEQKAKVKNQTIDF